jgi:hypothetical protein
MSPATLSIAPATLSLLRIPRELRDQIYSYLHYETSLDPLQYLLLRGYDDTSSLILTNAPIVNLLLMHPQIKAEYMESDCFKSLSATTNMEVDTRTYTATIITPPVEISKVQECRDRHRAALGHIRRLDVRVRSDEHPTSIRHLMWVLIDLVVQRTRREAPHLHTVRISCCFEPGQHLQDLNEVYSSFTSGVFSLPPSFACATRWRVSRALWSWDLNRPVSWSRLLRAYVYISVPRKCNSGTPTRFSICSSSKSTLNTAVSSVFPPSSTYLTERWYSGGRSVVGRQRLGSRLWAQLWQLIWKIGGWIDDKRRHEHRLDEDCFEAEMEGQHAGQTSAFQDSIRTSYTISPHVPSTLVSMRAVWDHVYW